jgi:hypothetical protein
MHLPEFFPRKNAMPRNIANGWETSISEILAADSFEPTGFLRARMIVVNPTLQGVKMSSLVPETMDDS